MGERKEVKEATSRTDYRGLPGEVGIEDNLAVTEELLELLEDFKQKSYTVKEMEILFENWRRKAAIPEELGDIGNTKATKEEKTAKSSYSILKLFRSNMTSETGAKIKRTSSTKKFLKPSSPEFPCDPSPTPVTTSALDEDKMGQVVELPPTPLKPRNSPPTSVPSGISSQILPLSRLSGSSLPHSSSSSSLQRQRPVAEVSPFTNKKTADSSLDPDVTQSSESSLTMRQTVTLRRQRSEEMKYPVKDRLQRMRRSITEPLMQYFHDIQLTSPDVEEPDVLNTPKSLINSQAEVEGDKRLSRRLFTSTVTTEAQIKERHSARTSQIHGYQNISPTPSTDL